jgi:quercetin dioxygenase-like cupin family protein
MKLYLLVGGLLVISLATVITINLVRAQQPGIKRTELQRHDMGIPGREAVQVLIDFQPGTAFAKHFHHGEELIYVIEGTLEYQVNDDAPVVLQAGEVLFIPSKAAHSARNKGTVKAKELATYIVEKGKPIVTIVK